MKKIAILPDIHAPFQDKKALALAVKVIKAFKPDILVQMGDIADMYAISQYDKDPRKSKGFLSELKAVNEVFDQLDGLAERKIFLEGNHCHRLKKYLFKKAPELHDYLSIKDVFRLDDRGWEHSPYQEPVIIGKLSLVHDLGFSGMNSLRQTINSYPANLIIAHTHRFESMTRGNLKRDKMTISNFGWLGDPRQIDYLPSVKVKQDWTHGFGLVHMEKDGTPHIEGVKISSGKCVIGGKVYTL